MNTIDLKAAKKFGPGYFIREQMEQRSWTQDDMATVLGITLKHVNKILTDKQPLTLAMARILGEVFNTSPQYWMNIDSGYRLWLQQEKSDKEKEADIKAKIYERMPVNDMIKKGWLPAYATVKELEKSVLTFWDWKSIDFNRIENHINFLTKKSQAYNQFNGSYAITWYKMAQNVALKRIADRFDKQKLVGLYDELHSFTNSENGINKFLEELKACGVTFFVLPHLQKTYLDGAAFIVNDNHPVIVYTGRYKRIDNFWFTIAHEIAHVLKHLDNKLTYVLDNFKEMSTDNIEDEANDMAAEKLKHREIFEYLSPYINYLTTEKVEECAEKYEIHPSIIIGKLAHDDIISYRNQSLYNENVLELIDNKFFTV